MFWWCHNITSGLLKIENILPYRCNIFHVPLTQNDPGSEVEVTERLRKWSCLMEYSWSRLVKNVHSLICKRQCLKKKFKFKKRTLQLFCTCRSYCMSLSQILISTLCQRRLWTTSRAFCLFVFCKKGQLPQQCQSTPGSLICEGLTVGLLPAQLVHRCACVCARVCRGSPLSEPNTD